MMPFKDHFSNHAVDYASYRPRYPATLFEYLACIAPGRELAWDCATGNGQAALGLANFFERVIATDASEKQIASAERHDLITYRVATAEQSGLEARSVELITVAQALHWLEREAFFTEAKRILKRNGALAVWCYNLLEVCAKIDAPLKKFYRETVGPYWDFERQLVETGYGTIDFPFVELATPKFRIEADWSLTHLLGYLRTWSATKTFIAARGFDPVTDLTTKLLPRWGQPETFKRVTWQLGLRVGLAPG